MQLNVTKCLSTVGRGGCCVVLVLQYSPRNGDELENNTEIPIHTPRLDKAIAGIGAISFAKYTTATTTIQQL
jgi:hypothetical protein